MLSSSPTFRRRHKTLQFRFRSIGSDHLVHRLTSDAFAYDLLDVLETCSRKNSPQFNDCCQSKTPADRSSIALTGHNLSLNVKGDSNSVLNSLLYRECRVLDLLKAAVLKIDHHIVSAVHQQGQLLHDHPVRIVRVDDLFKRGIGSVF